MASIERLLVVVIPETLSCLVNNVGPVTVVIPANVANPTTLSFSPILTLSSSVCPSTSKSPFASITQTKVVMPLILTLSSSVCPSTSKSPVASIFSKKLEEFAERPAAKNAVSLTVKFLVVVTPAT